MFPAPVERPIGTGISVVAVGLAIGSVVAVKTVPLEHAVKILPLGIAMGFVVLGMVW